MHSVQLRAEVTKTSDLQKLSDSFELTKNHKSDNFRKSVFST